MLPLPARPPARRLQVWSNDDGATWGKSTVISYAPFNNTGGLIGPSVGIQAADGTIYFSTRSGGVGYFNFFVLP